MRSTCGVSVWVLAMSCLLGPSAVLSIPACPEGQEWKNCGPACNTDCENYSPTAACFALCVQGCFCPPGQLKKTVSDGSMKKEICVFPDECKDEMQCPGNQVYSKCGGGCRATCKDPHPVCITLAVCVPGCVCPTGTLWDESQSQCVKECKPQECKSYCDQCNVCTKCDDGPAACTRIGCIEPTPENIVNSGCWRSINGKCHFVSPCPGEQSCKTDATVCKECVLCECFKDKSGSVTEVCPLFVKDPECDEQLKKWLLNGEFCWSLHEDRCRIIAPCPHGSPTLTLA